MGEGDFERVTYHMLQLIQVLVHGMKGIFFSFFRHKCKVSFRNRGNRREMRDEGKKRREMPGKMGTLGVFQCLTCFTCKSTPENWGQWSEPCKRYLFKTNAIKGHLLSPFCRFL